jgi:hypothetical protein
MECVAIYYIGPLSLMNGEMTNYYYTDSNHLLLD